MKYEDKNRTFYRIITIVLLIIIIIILLFFNYFGEINNNIDDNHLIPTGNVDVFDIEINHNCKDINCIVTDIDNKIIPTFNETTDKNIVGKVFIDDKSGNYLYQENLQIFNNSAYEFTDKIAPGVSNTYHFVIHNSTNSLINYKIKMYEDSEYKLNIVYRLKKGDSYVIGNSKEWVSAKKLITEFNCLNRSRSDDYSLDWKWKYDGNDENDTLAGINMDSKYKLNIRVYFEKGNS